MVKETKFFRKQRVKAGAWRKPPLTPKSLNVF
jgi:hypothetical protein